MYFGRVVGRVWSTAKDPRMTGQRLLMIQPLTPELRHTGKPLVCADSTGAGAGELIYWVRGKEASFPFPEEPPFDTTVVGIVDEVYLNRPGGAGSPARPVAPGTPPPPRRKRQPC